MKKGFGILLGIIFALSILVFSITPVLAITPLADNMTLILRNASNPSSPSIGGERVSLNVTLAGGVYMGTITVNVTAKSTSTANSSWVILNASLQNNSIGTLVSCQTEVTQSVNNRTCWYGEMFLGKLVEDSNDYILNVSISNGTYVISKSITSVTIDKGLPPAPTSLVPTTNSNGSVQFSATVTNENTTSCTLFFQYINPGSPSYTTTYSTTSCVRTINNIPQQNYVWWMQASDGTNTTNSSSQTTIVDIPGNSGVGAYYSSKGRLSQITKEPLSVAKFYDNNRGAILFIGGILVLIIV